MTSSIPKIRIIGRINGIIATVFYLSGFFFNRLSLSGGFENGLIRGIISVVAVFAVSLKTKEPLFTNHQSLYMTLLRMIVFAGACVCAAFSTQLVKVSVFVVVSRTKSLLYSYVGVVLLGNNVDWRTIVAAIISILGVVMVICPGVLGFTTPGQNSLSLDWTASEILGIILTLMYMVLDTAEYALILKMSGNVNPAQMNMYANIGVCILNGLFLVGDHQTRFFVSDIWKYLGIGLSFYFANALYIESSAMESDMSIQATIQTSIAFSVVFDVAFLHVSLSIPNIFGCLSSSEVHYG